MDRAGSPPGAPPRTAASAWLIPPGVLAGACGIALLAVPAEIRLPVAWSGLAAVVLTALTSALTARRARASEAARHARATSGVQQFYAQREAALFRRLADQRTTVVWLAEELLPAAVARLRRGEPTTEIVRTIQFGDHIDAEFAEALRGALRTLLDAVELEERTRDSSQRALVAIARRVQAIVHQLGKELHEMQMLHGTDLVVSRGLQTIDHRNALVGRLAASIAVLGDSRPGRQWSKPITLYDIIRGGMSRIVAYPRVKLQSIAEVAIIGRGAEPLMHLLAELLDNATTFSPPNSPVQVNASEVPTGVAIEIEDRGVGLTEEVRHRVERTMERSAAGHIDFSDLGETTQLGMPVVARLAKEHNFVVDLRTSAYGGVRAVVLVPRGLITTIAPPALKFQPRAPKHRRAPDVPNTPPVPSVPRPAPTRDGAADSAELPTTTNGLPQRRRHSPVPTPVVRTSPEPPPAPSRRRTRPPGLMWEAFKGIRPSSDPDSPTSEPSDKGE
ncbi:ATP-binding protein [Streptomyces sp. MUM 203J]|uniref:sensor histidine kinase n=1 Tax=Streptomyces sp. MUM 203J TaxID=2791990 RepID=UPI001F0418FE|nr:ATP-binding protein [Streptomyces sp. MUM 203J]MCH0542269.1 ATP-binding protein [Streptomyces sp. MUM 203J]